ncbi:hypothetical protein V8F20_005139 [Naviculisporaceae sp. PSN 640]
MKMDISSQNEGKIYLPSSPSQGNNGYMPPGMRIADTPAWSTTTYSPPPQAPSYHVPTHEGNYVNYTYATPPPDLGKERTILGLRKTTFILSAIIAVLVLALALGLGIGLGVTRNGQKDEQNGFIGCKQAKHHRHNLWHSNANSHIPGYQQRQANCHPDQDCQPARNRDSLPGSPVPRLPVPRRSLSHSSAPRAKRKACDNIRNEMRKDSIGFDIMNTMAYSLEDCMRACAMYNHFSKPLVCAGVQFWKDIEDATRKWDGNCFLKSEVATTLGNKAPGDTVWAEVVDG